jgi:coenzyme F420 hydrogenase subunit beta
MKETIEIGGQKDLLEKVIDTGLCTNCGACINLCPYTASWNDQAIMIHRCDREEGRCFAFCPRTPTDLETLRQRLFDPEDLTLELGSVKGFYVARAANEKVRRSAQHGGTVTTLLALALQEGMIDAAVVAEEESNGLPHGVLVHTPAEVEKRGKSKFVVSPTVAKFNEAVKDRHEKIGVVATPCQALAFAKMRLKPFPTNDNNIGKLRLVIGLFCGWALSWRELKRLLKEKTEGRSIAGLDIPPSQYHTMEVYTPQGTIQISLDDVMPAIRKGCQYCIDMTAEFSDISVGAGRCPEGWEVARHWNQIIVRSQVGQDLITLAKSRALLEFRDVPEGNIERLKKASMSKRRAALKNLCEKTGNPKDLLYLNNNDPLLCELLE